MIPEIRVPVLNIFYTGDKIYFVSFYTLMLLMGIACGIGVTLLRTREKGGSVYYTLGSTVILALVGLVGSQLMYLAYFPERIQEVGIWGTISSLHNPKSSLGGMLFGTVGFFAITSIVKPPGGRLVFFDILLPGTIVGYIFGRLGCTLIHDHIGVETTFFLGVHYADGVHHNLGMYEFFFLLFILYPLSISFTRAGARPGMMTAVCVGLYAIVRFGLDFLRTDTTYGSLTPGQYGCMVLLLISLAVYRHISSGNPEYS